MKPRKSLLQMASQEPRQVSGHPADSCPYCGCTLFIDGVNRTDKEVTRYIECRNQNCRRRFLSYQPAAKILREITKENSADGKPNLTLMRDVI